MLFRCFLSPPLFSSVISLLSSLPILPILRPPPFSFRNGLGGLLSDGDVVVVEGVGDVSGVCIGGVFVVYLCWGCALAASFGVE